MKSLFRTGEELLCFPRNLVRVLECFDATGNWEWFGISPEQAARYVDRFQTILRILPETPEIFPAWRKLVLQHRVSGIKVHDARIVAAMSVHQVPKILTFDLDDFKRYENITVVHPISL